jgi:plastocyanin
MSNTSLVWLVIVVILIALGGWYFLSQNPGANVTPSTATQTNQNPNGPDTTPGGTTNVSINVTNPSPATSATVNDTASGFTPGSVTIKVGGTVTWLNQSGGQMWIASAVHPTHSSYDGTTRDAHCAAGYTGATPFDECSAGNSYSFTFTKVGTWAYHNHLNPSQTGTVVVVQ